VRKLQKRCNNLLSVAIILVMMVERMTQIADESLAEMDLLVQKAKGDSGAFGQLYDIYYRRILNYCQHRLFNVDVAEDVASQVFLAVAGQIKAFRGDTEKAFACWIYKIASNKANDYLRKMARRNRILLEAANTLAKDFAVDSPKDDLNWPGFYQAIAKLKPKEQTIITLRFFENLSYDQISEIIGVKPSTIGVKVHRALKKLRNHLHNFVDGGI